jgi:hypothetical protein
MIAIAGVFAQVKGTRLHFLEIFVLLGKIEMSGSFESVYHEMMLEKMLGVSRFLMIRVRILLKLAFLQSVIITIFFTFFLIK